MYFTTSLLSRFEVRSEPISLSRHVER